MSPKRRVPDASMELLNSIQRDTVDPEYAAAATGSQSSGRRDPLLVIAVGLLAGLMLATSGLGAGRQSANAASERGELISQIEQTNQRNQELRNQADAVGAEIAELEHAQLGPSQDDPGVLVWSGATAVTGAGVLLVLNDNPREAHGILVDQDMRHVVNGLWLAGAEAVAINGHRLSARTAIRQAGSAITVDYRSLTAPYRIEAIGDPHELTDGFRRNSGGAWLSFLRSNYGVSWSMESKAELTLGGDAGLDIENAAIG